MKNDLRAVQAILSIKIKKLRDSGHKGKINFQRDIDPPIQILSLASGAVPGFTSLMYAMAWASPDVVRELLDAGADPHALPKVSYMDPFAIACKFARIESVRNV